jgi:superfamily I DNA/RNA helicase
MSLWWARREQLDEHQLELIENLPLRENHLILGPPGSGKTNVLLRRAQFVRSQGMPNVMVATFTRPLTEFIKTGCSDSQNREIFPRNCVTTVESWIRWLYQEHNAALPDDPGNLHDWKTALATAAMNFAPGARLPRFDALFIDEAQDLMPVEVELFSRWSPVLFFVGDDRQRIYQGTRGLEAVRQIAHPGEQTLPFHYRLAPELCEMADRILLEGEVSLAATCHYDGPRPGRIDVHGPLSKDGQLEAAANKLRDQIRAYADLIRQGDLLGIIVARTSDRDVVLTALESDPVLQGKSQIVRARTGDEDDEYDPTLDSSRPICILTVQGCKGLEFRAVHWLFCEELSTYHNSEHYYTVTTRAKTSLDIYYTRSLPQILARAYAPQRSSIW